MIKNLISKLPSKYFRREDLSNINTILIINAAKPEDLDKVFWNVRNRFGNSKIALIFQEEYEEHVNNNYGNIEKIKYCKTSKLNKLKFFMKNTSQKYDLVVTTFTNEKCMNSFKIMAFLAKAKYILAYNENGDSFFVNIYNRKILNSHMKWRKGQENKVLSSYKGNLLSSILRKFIFLVLFLVMIARFFIIKRNAKSKISILLNDDI